MDRVPIELFSSYIGTALDRGLPIATVGEAMTYSFGIIVARCIVVITLTFTVIVCFTEGWSKVNVLYQQTTPADNYADE